MKKISIITPTLNSENYIEILLKSIFKQKKVITEILICDGGSTDKTLEILKNYEVKILNNKLKTAEAGKQIGLIHSQYDYIVFLDSDNELIDDNYLSNSIDIMEKNKNVVFVEPISFLFKKNDSLINKYCSIIGCNDPIDIYLERYDKFSYLKKNILGSNYKILKEDNSKIIYEIDNINIFPTYGANGTVINKKYLINNIDNEYYFDNEEIYKIYLNNNKRLILCKHKSQIAHYYCNDINIFIKKQSRRIKDFIYFQTNRKQNVINKYLKYQIGMLIIKSILILPIIFDTFIIFIRSKKQESLIHFVLIYLTLYIYIKNIILGKISKRFAYLNRNYW